MVSAEVPKNCDYQKNHSRDFECNSIQQYSFRTHAAIQHNERQITQSRSALHHTLNDHRQFFISQIVDSGNRYDNTDELGYNAVENPVHVRDFHATMLHMLGLDHDRFSYKFQGLDFRLTGVEEAHVIKDVIG